MKITWFAIFFFLLFSCSNNSSYKKATDAQDAGREFIRASLDGDIKKASFYLLPDSVNKYLFNIWKDQYSKLSSAEKREYRNAEIRPVRIEKQNDSVVNYTFTNSYKQKDTTVIKVVRLNGDWFVDIKEIHSMKN